MRLPDLRPRFERCSEPRAVIYARHFLRVLRAPPPLLLAAAATVAALHWRLIWRSAGWALCLLINLTLLLIAAVLYNQLSLLGFYLTSVTKSYAEFARVVRTASGELDVRVMQSLLTCREYRCGATFLADAAPKAAPRGRSRIYDDARVVTGTSTWLIDLLISLLVPFLSVRYPLPGNKVALRHPLLHFRRGREPEFASSSVESLFRRYLAVVGGIARPVTCTDAYYLYDTPENRCEIIGLAVLEPAAAQTAPLRLQELSEHIRANLVPSDTKLICTLTRLFGRPAWKPQILPARAYWGDRYHSADQKADRYLVRKIAALRMPALDREVMQSSPTASHLDRHSTASPILGCFDLSAHVYEVHVDAARATIHEVVSELASSPLPNGAPPWRIILLKIHDGSETPMRSPPGSDRSSTVFSDDSPALSDSADDSTRIKTCIVFQCHHGLGDGVAIMYALLRHFFDPPSAAELAALQMPRVPPLKLFAFCCQQVFTTALWFVPALIYWMAEVAKPPCLFELPSRLRIPDAELPRFKPIGVKYLSPPVLIPLSEINELRKQIDDVLRVSGQPQIHPTLNDIMMYCISAALVRCRSGAAAEDVLLKLQQWQPGDSAPDRTPWNSTRHVCGGITPRVDDLSMPHRPAEARSILPRPATYQMLMPMSTRVSAPTGLDNITATVICQMPLPSLQPIPQVPGFGDEDLLCLAQLAKTKRAIDTFKRKNLAWRWFLLASVGAQVCNDRFINVSRPAATAASSSSVFRDLADE